MRYISENNPYIKNFIQTEQFAYSEMILDYRFENDLSIEEMASLLNMDLEIYYDYEFGDTALSVESYKRAINRLGL